MADYGAQSNTAYLAYATPPTPVPSTLASDVTWNSGVMSLVGFRQISVSAELNETGTLTLQRYLDRAGTIPIGDAITQAMSASTVATVALPNDGLACASFIVTVENTSGSTGNLSNVVIVMGQGQ